MPAKDYYTIAYEAAYGLYVVRERATGKKVGTAPTEFGARRVRFHAERRNER